MTSCHAGFCYLPLNHLTEEYNFNTVLRPLDHQKKIRIELYNQIFRKITSMFIPLNKSIIKIYHTS